MPARKQQRARAQLCVHFRPLARAAQRMQSVARIQQPREQPIALVYNAAPNLKGN